MRQIPEISTATWAEFRTALGGSYATDVTGGMLGKVEEMLKLVRDLPDLTVKSCPGSAPVRWRLRWSNRS